MRAPSTRLLPPIRLALLHLALAAATAVAVEAVLVQAGPNGGIPVAYAYPALAAVYAGTGVLAWWRRPANRLGPLLLVAAAAWLLGGLQNTGVPALIGLGLVTSSLPLSLVVHLLHAAPGGVVRGAASRWTVGAVYVVGLVLQVPLWAFGPQPPPFDVVLMSPRPDLALAGYRVQQVCGVAVVLVSVWLFARRLRTYDRDQRRALAPVFGYGLVAVLAIPIGSDLLGPFLGPERTIAVQLVPLAGIPIGLVTVVLRGGFAPTGELAALAGSAAAADSRQELEEAVVRTLGDPSAALLPPSPVGDAPREPTGGHQRGLAPVRLGTRDLGGIAYDTQLNPDPAAVAAVAQVVAVALDRERLAAEATRSREELRDASARLLEAGDLGRRRIARDLHDGVQGSLVRLSMQAHQLAAEAVEPADRELAARMAADVDAAAAALRGLVQGVMPSPLVERGLAAAVQELVYALPVPVTLDVDGVPERLPAPVESTAFFVVAEALTNVVKHAGASRVDVRLGLGDGELSVDVHDDGRGGVPAEARGSGLRGLRDRLEVLGGRLTVTSGPAGTRLQAAVPCGS